MTIETNQIFELPTQNDIPRLIIGILLDQSKGENLDKGNIGIEENKILTEAFKKLNIKKNEKFKSLLLSVLNKENDDIIKTTIEQDGVIKTYYKIAVKGLIDKEISDEVLNNLDKQELFFRRQDTFPCQFLSSGFYVFKKEKDTGLELALVYVGVNNQGNYYSGLEAIKKFYGKRFTPLVGKDKKTRVRGHPYVFLPEYWSQ